MDRREKAIIHKALAVQFDMLKTVDSDQILPGLKVLLEKELFDDAMTIYMDADEGSTTKYKVILMSYFSDGTNTSSDKRIGEILQFIEIEPESREFQYLLVTLYVQRKEYLKAIDQITILKDNYTNEYEDNKLYALLKSVADSYIDALQKAKEFDRLIPFLEQMMEYEIFRVEYAFGLAKLYFGLQKYDESQSLLQEVKEDKVYEMQAKNLLDEIEKLEETAREYEYQIPLKKIGDHFSIQVTVNDAIALNLMIDTGATYTHIDKGKLTSFTLLRGDVKLRTAGGEIAADLCQVNTFSVQDIELQNFKIMISPFDHTKVDGLLGMNFFKRFKFFLNQKESVLYLSEKE